MKHDPKQNRSGEAYVWLTAMGLTVGLCMVMGLLGLITWNGIKAFWPKKVVQIRLNDSGGFGVAGSELVAGEIASGGLQPVSSRSNETARREIQLFTMNKEVYGFSFKYLPLDSVRDHAFPPSIMKITRYQDGPILGYPAVILDSNNERIDVEDPRFEMRLKEIHDQTEVIRSRIRHIERAEIPRLSRELEATNARIENAADKRIDELAAKRSELENRMQIKVNEVQSFWEELAAPKLNLTLAGGREFSVDIGQIKDYFKPNALSTLDIARRFLSNIGSFLSEEPRNANTEGGVFPALFGTFTMTLIMSIAVMPFGVIAAIYLREYARQGPIVHAVRIAINNLAGVPSIVFGVFGLGFFVYFLGGTIDRAFYSDKLPTATFGTGGLLWASLTLALMTVPVVIVSAEEALASVPRGVREGSLACGASKWQTLYRVVLPAAAPGILTGLVLAMARGAGEVAPLMLVGVVNMAPELPVDLHWPFVHFDQKFMHLGFHIYDLGFQSPDSEAAKPMIFATTLLLILLVIALNLTALIIRERLRQKYKTSAF